MEDLFLLLISLLVSFGLGYVWASIDTKNERR